MAQNGQEVLSSLHAIRTHYKNEQDLLFHGKTGSGSLTILVLDVILLFQ